MRGRREVDLRRCWRPATWLLSSLLVSVLLVSMSVLLRNRDVVEVRRRQLSTPFPPPPSHPSATSTPLNRQYQVRLVNGHNRCEGRVEVLHNDTWGTVCDDTWDMVDANVVCRQLDCGLAVAVGTSSQFGQGSGAIMLDNVDCKGGETHLSQCANLGWGVHNCYHYEDVAVICRGHQVMEGRGGLEPTTPPLGNSVLRDGALRLVGGRDQCQGRVEVYYRGSWGTVCDDDWDQKNAEVVCGQMDCGQAVSAHRNSYFGNGRGEILLDNVNCTGQELQLYRCYSLGWGTNNCGHHEDAGVTCTGRPTTATPVSATANTESEILGGRGFFFTDMMPATNGTQPVTQTTVPATTTTTTTTPTVRVEQQKIRVVNGNSSCQGRVEVLYATIWGTVCDDDWGMANAQVVCRQLGCGPAIEAKTLAYYGYGTVPILMDNVECKGDEPDLASCFHLGWGQHNCGHHEDAGVICASSHGDASLRQAFGAMQSMPPITLPSEGAVRLTGGLHRCEGRVEMFSSSEWGTVCDDAWDIPDAQVVCNQLGCGQAMEARPEAFFGPGVGTILLDNLKCNGDEASLRECSHIAWDVHNCDHTEDAGVTCSMS